MPRNLSARASIVARLAPIVGLYRFVWPAIGTNSTSTFKYHVIEVVTLSPKKLWLERNGENKQSMANTLKPEKRDKKLQSLKKSHSTHLTCFRAFVTCCEGNRLRCNLKANCLSQAAADGLKLQEGPSLCSIPRHIEIANMKKYMLEPGLLES